MLSFRDFFTATAVVAMTLGTAPLASADDLASRLAKEAVWGSNGDGSPYRIWVVNNSNRDLWMTYYRINYYWAGQIGTQCIPPGKRTFFASQSWANNNPTTVRAEMKSGAGCGGDTWHDAQLQGSMLVSPNGGTTITVVNDGDRHIRSSLSP